MFQTEHWLVEHSVPASIYGWSVIAAKRHIISPHELTSEEFAEFGAVLEKTCRVLYQELKCERLYNLFYGEAENFNHLHYHIVPIPHNFPKEHRGSKIFAYNKNPENQKSLAEIKKFAEYLQTKF
jgi:diadenosine tetraphosphate (Ap4A) HIT family hydrolase